MTQPAGPILGAVHLDDRVNTKFRWNEEVGLSTPSSKPLPSVQTTFGGALLVLPTASAAPPKDVELPGYLLQVNGLAEGYERLLRVYELAAEAGKLSVLQVGALSLNLMPEPPMVERLKAHRVQLDFNMRAVAAPGIWSAMYGTNAGGAFGMVANAESHANTGVFQLASTTSPSVTNPGSAPTPLVLTISTTGALRTTRYFVRCTAAGYTKRISVTPDSAGIVRITEAHGLFVPPGTSALRYEESNGTLIAGTTCASSIYGTRWRYQGLDDALSEIGPAIIYNTRQMRAYAATAAFTASSGLTLYQPDVPRFGSPGTYDATDAGLLVEPDRTNSCQQSNTLATAPWTTAGMITLTNSYGTDPAGVATSTTRMVFTAAMAGSVAQSITLTNAVPYVVSFYVKNTIAASQTFTISMGAVLASTVVTSNSTSWQRYAYLVTGTGVAVNLTFADNAMAAADVQIWGVQVERADGQVSANATSVIPTTSSTQRRHADDIGVRKAENLLAWSNSFERGRTTTSTDRGLWYVAAGTITSAGTLQTGPGGVVDASTLTAAGAVGGIQQLLLNAEDLSNKTIMFSVWVKNSTSTPDNDLQISIVETSSSSGTTSNSTAALDTNWRRLTVSRKLSANVTNVSLQIGTTGAITAYFAHAQAFVIGDGTYGYVTSGVAAISAPYIETFGTPYVGNVGWVWPDWLTQNGYLEADICFNETGNPASSQRTILGAINTAFNSNIWPGTFYRSSGFAGTTMSFAKTFVNTSGAVAQNTSSYAPAATLYDNLYRKYRVEWVNYLLNNVRTIQLRLYVDGTLVASSNSTNGARWLRPPALQIAGTDANQTMKNIAIGSPVLPMNAIPEPY